MRTKPIITGCNGSYMFIVAEDLIGAENHTTRSRENH